MLKGRRSGPTAIGLGAAAPNVSSAAGFGPSAKAREALERALESVRRDKGVASSLTLSKLVAEYLAQHEADKRTIEKLRWLLGKAIAAFGDRPLRELTRPKQGENRSPESDSNRRPLPYHRPKEGSSGAVEDVEDRTLRTSEDVDDPAVSSSYGPNAAQELGGAKKVHPNIAHVVASRRRELGLSQRELAERAGTSHTVIGRIESGRHAPNIRTFERLADALGLCLVIGFDEGPRQRL
jgi:DNA-binding XRE family transcriptional regulator